MTSDVEGLWAHFADTGDRTCLTLLVDAYQDAGLSGESEACRWIMATGKIPTPVEYISINGVDYRCHRLWWDGSTKSSPWFPCYDLCGDIPTRIWMNLPRTWTPPIFKNSGLKYFPDDLTAFRCLVKSFSTAWAEGWRPDAVSGVAGSGR